ncbi:head GIN domain-containing protein [Ideonella sp.]|uniref:head GIN domain-containing protein n=1 Tax=Ideonella sp. TaxID=1929293 RepID=UPI0037BE2D0B
MARFFPRMSPLLLAVALVAAAALPPLTAQALTIEYSSGGTMVKGSGKVVEQNRAVSAFSKLRLEGSFTVEAKSASSVQVSVRADDNLADLIETVVEGDTLVVRGKPKTSWRTSSPMVVSVSFTQLQGAELRGSGDLNIHKLQADRFSAAVSGSGDMRLEGAQLSSLTANLAGSGDLNANGTAQQVDVNLAGSGDVDLSKLLARQAKVNLAGSGDVNVHAAESVEVNLIGSGDVRVWGKPAKVSRKVVGSGDIHLK